MKIDWTIAVTILSIIGTIANTEKKRWCFVIWLFTNTFWCVYDWCIGAYSQSLLFAVYAMLAIWGLVRWKRDDRRNSSGTRQGGELDGSYVEDLLGRYEGETEKRSGGEKERGREGEEIDRVD